MGRGAIRLPNANSLQALSRSSSFSLLLLDNLLSMYRDALRSVDSYPHLVAFDPKDCDGNPAIDNDSLLRPARKYQH